jgi:thioredoxin
MAACTRRCLSTEDRPLDLAHATLHLYSKDSLVKSSQFIGTLGLLVLMTGCASRPTFPFFAKRESKAEITAEPEVVAEAAKPQTESIQQADLTAGTTPSSDPAQTKLVSAMTTSSFTQPTLMTLPKGSDLDAQVAAASGPVVLDFYADWCGPCRTQGKILHEMEDFAAANKAQIIKVNVDEHPEIAKKLQVSSLPTLIVMKDGKVSQRVTGLTQREQIEQWIKP